MNFGVIEKAQSLLADGKDEEAVSLLLPLVKAGNHSAKSNLAFIYAYSVKLNNIKAAESLFVEACDAGEPSACHNLGTLWLGNEPAIGKDYKKAAHFYLRARELGGPVADEGFYKHWEEVIKC